MQYKTLILEFLQQHPEIYDRLLKNRMLLPTLERFGGQLRDSHLAWKELLSQARPGSDESQISSESLEMALKDLADSLAPESTPNENGPLSLDAAMAFIRGYTQPA